jgi:hypothetical protein
MMKLKKIKWQFYNKTEVKYLSSKVSLSSGGSTGVEQSPRHVMIKGSIPAAGKVIRVVSRHSGKKDDIKS